MSESLQRWPLLRVICDTLAVGGRRRRAAADPFGSRATVIEGTGDVERPLASGGDGAPLAPSKSEPISGGEQP